MSYTFAAPSGDKDKPRIDRSESGPSILSDFAGTKPQFKKESEFVGQQDAAIAALGQAATGDPAAARRYQEFKTEQQKKLDAAEAGSNNIPTGGSEGGAGTSPDQLEAMQILQQMGSLPQAPQMDPFAGAQGLLDMASANLSDMLAGISADSSTSFGTIQGAAGDRGAAALQSLQGINADLASRLGAVPSGVSGGRAATGGLEGGILAEGAASEAAPISDMQAQLGGFLEGSQVRRTNAVQNFLSGLEGQSQIVQDRARTAGEFAIMQQQALLDREQALRQQDAATQAAQQATLEALGLPNIPGVGPAELLGMLPQERRDQLLFGGGADGAGAQVNLGPVGQEFADFGVNPQAAAQLEPLELEMNRQVENLASLGDTNQMAMELLTPLQQQQVEQNPELLQQFSARFFNEDGGLTQQGIEQVLEENIIVTGQDDPRLYQRVDLGGGRGERLFLTQEDYNNYLQWVNS